MNLGLEMPPIVDPKSLDTLELLSLREDIDATFIRSEYDRWIQIIHDAGIRLDCSLGRRTSPQRQARPAAGPTVCWSRKGTVGPVPAPGEATLPFGAVSPFSSREDGHSKAAGASAAVVRATRRIRFQ